MRIVCIVFVFLGVINGIAIADQGHQLGLLDEMPSPDDVQRHLQAKKKPKDKDSDVNNADSTDSSGNKNFDGEFTKVINNRVGDDKNNPNNNRRPLTKEAQEKKELQKKQNFEKLKKDKDKLKKFEESKAILVARVRETVGDGMANKVKEELQKRGCLRRNLREVSDSRILIVPNLAEDSRADDDDKAGKKRRLVESREEKKEREDRLQQLKNLDGLAQAMNDEQKKLLVKAMKDLNC